MNSTMLEQPPWPMHTCSGHEVLFAKMWRNQCTLEHREAASNICQPTRDSISLPTSKGLWSLICRCVGLQEGVGTLVIEDRIEETPSVGSSQLQSFPRAVNITRTYFWIVSTYGGGKRLHQILLQHIYRDLTVWSPRTVFWKKRVYGLLSQKRTTRAKNAALKLSFSN